MSRSCSELRRDAFSVSTRLALNFAEDEPGQGSNNHQRIGLYHSSHHDVHEFFDLPSLLSNSYEARKSAIWCGNM